MTLDDKSVEQAIADNQDLPEGRARNTHAEQVVELAERIGDEADLTRALLNLIKAYNYSSERDKILVPFARLLRRYDSHPDYFDRDDVHSLFWYFKWVSSDMIEHPGISLNSIEDWLSEMAHRYSQSGHSLDAVHKSQLIVAMHLGDGERSRQAYERWMGTERDNLSDCLACDLSRQGHYLVQQGDDVAALDRWRPLLDGDQSCKTQPHHVFGTSLLPLLRLGRFDEARSNHLRGYRMVRRQEHLLGTIGRHIEFCALTGNEARGLELVAENDRFLTGVHDKEALASFQTGAAVLLRRLVSRGLGGQEVPGPDGRVWTATELLARLESEIAEVDARFDARNRNTTVSERTRERLEREPFHTVLLGTGTSRSLPVPPPIVRARPSSPQPGDLDSLITEARVLQRNGHPHGDTLWSRVAELAEAQGRDLEPGIRGDILVARFNSESSSPADQRGLLQTAADLYTQAGLGFEAQRCLLIEASIVALTGESVAARAQSAKALAAVNRLHDNGEAGIRDQLRAHLEAIRTEYITASHDKAAPEVFADLDNRLAELEDRAATHTEAEALRSVRGHGALFRAELAEQRGDIESAMELLRDCLRHLRASDREWMVRMPSLGLANFLLQQDRTEEAQEVIEAALAVEDLEGEADVSAQLHWHLAQLLLARGRLEEALTHALEAGRWYEVAGNPIAAAFNHYLAARAYLGLDRPFEAATVLETALPLLEGEEPEAAIDARFHLINALMAIGENGAAAEHAIAGVNAATDRSLSYEHARYATLAGQALGRDGKHVQAIPALLAAARLWRDLDEWTPYASILRSRANLRAEKGAVDSARRELDELDEELRSVRDASEASRHSQFDHEIALCRHARAHLLSTHLDQIEDATVEQRRHVVKLAREAAVMLETLGPECLTDRLNVERLLVFYLSEAGDNAAALAQAQAGQKLCQGDGPEIEWYSSEFDFLVEQYSP